MSDEIIGAVVARRWKLTRLIGAGAVGAVYEATDLRGGEPRAVKLLLPEHGVDRALGERFVAEALAVARLSHPNIVRAEEAGKAEDGTPYLVMPLLSGHPLSQYTDTRQRLDVERVCRLVFALLGGLDHAHAAGVVHRDVKPANVFVGRMPSGKYSSVLLDFGVAKVLEESGRFGSRTATGALIGTPAYMSPEQLTDARRIDHRTDLWSVGVMTYQLLSGALPFRDPDPVQAMFSVLTTDPHPIEQVVPTLVRWRGFFERALARDPAHRFDSARAMAEGLIAVYGKQVPMDAFGVAAATSPQAASLAPTDYAIPAVPLLVLPGDRR